MTLSRVGREQVPAPYQAMIDESLELTGDARFLEVAANAPHITHFYFDQFYGEVFYGGKVAVRIKELVRLRLSRLHGCAL